MDPAPYLLPRQNRKDVPITAPVQRGESWLDSCQEQPENAFANFYYAISIWKREKRSEDPAGRKHAETLLEKAVAIDPNLDEGYLQLGMLHSARGDFEQAIRDYKKASRCKPAAGRSPSRAGHDVPADRRKAKAQEEFETFKKIEKAEAAERERERRELRQFSDYFERPARRHSTSLRKSRQVIFAAICFWV